MEAGSGDGEKPNIGGAGELGEPDVEKQEKGKPGVAEAGEKL